MSEDIRIYVADLAAYNAGHLHGTWVDATQELEAIQAQVDAMLAASPVQGSEEYAIHDYEGFDGYPLGEYEGLQTAHEIACFIEDYPDFGGTLLAHCNDLEQARKAAEEDYCGCYSSLADYAQELT
ncbi:Antirestriction protein [Pseudomonas cuatrocienegasensis]|uniref:Antirestriction protein n=1 Tax=Pseudomonas cuatrocienegasensis TaxID=543360 RepID=A0ABY1BR88_9PSED|nr:Antirestriction protein [Pseudomonas cuatrocienegasensis]